MIAPKALLPILLASALAAPIYAQQPADKLAEGFAQPPHSASPLTFWHWINGNVTRDGITRDLEAMKRVGLGGVMIFDGGKYLPDGPAGYLGPEWRKLMTHAIQEGNRLDLDIDMHNSPGWSSSGGPWVKPEQAMQQLVWTETTVQGGKKIDIELPQPEEKLGFYRDAMVVAFPTPAGEKTRDEKETRLPKWKMKANFEYRIHGQPVLPPAAPADAVIDPTSVVDLTKNFKDGWLTWDAPVGSWTILRIGHTPTGQKNVAASAAGTGLEIDKFNAAATVFHFDHIIKQVMADAAAVGAKGPAGITIDSYEAGMQNWTANFPAEFQKRMGYEIWRYAPALFGRIVGDTGVSERFLFDFRRVQADLMAENYYGKMGELAKKNGLRFYVEGYGPGNFDELRVGGIGEVPMTEFWTRTPWTPNRSVKMVTSAAHVYGKPVVAAESFTGEAQTSRWLEYPYALKALGDEMFAHGMNRMVFHSYVHQPHPDAAPGLTLGPYGFGFTRTNTWFDQAGPWIDYLKKSQFLLQQGTYVADVLYLTGERSPEPAQMAMPVLPPGTNYDLVNDDVLFNRVRVVNGDFVLPEGGRYRLLALPPEMKAMTPKLVTKSKEFVDAGGTILGPKPEFSPTLAGWPESEREMRRVADELWDPSRKGPGRVIPSGSIGEALALMDVKPDFTFESAKADTTLSWEHRRLSDGDLFFIGNRQRDPREVLASFRGMAGRQPEIWQAESGSRRLAPVFRTEDDRVIMPLPLDPAESVFVLFRQPAGKGVEAILRDGQPVISTAVPVARTNAGPSGDFTMMMWVKPDTDLRVMPKESTSGRIDEVGKFYAIPADPGDLRFGPGHATAGLAVGRNGIFVIERSSDASPAVLVSDTKVSGWTHVAVVYRGGKPRLYVNGKFVREGLVSGRTVHSGIDSPPPPVDYLLNFPGIASIARSTGQAVPPSRGEVFEFEGNFTPPVEFSSAMSDEEIAKLALASSVPTQFPGMTDLDLLPDGKVAALVWGSGKYSIPGGPAVDATVPHPVFLDGPWKVAFEANRGAPESITLPELKSLHLHEDAGVKYFSGVATYTHELMVPAGFLQTGRRVVLDLGRVEVTAEVFVNGKNVGTVWKEPYRLDITDAVKAGKNTLEVRVANLWANRLIGDEQLPTEDKFGLRDEQGNDPHGLAELPDWYREGKPKPPGGRITFAAWRHYNKDEPLVASGLLGPVYLLNPVRVELPRKP